MTKESIKIENLSKKYLIGNSSSGKLQETLINLFRSQSKTVLEEFWALKNINFKILFYNNDNNLYLKKFNFPPK